MKFVCPKSLIRPEGAAFLCSRTGSRGFTIVELLAVVAIMALLMAFMGPAVNSISEGRGLTSKIYNVADLLEQARNYAIANNTYTWIGFFEENGNTQWTRNKVQGGSGRIIASVVASLDGRRYNLATDTFVAKTVTSPSATQIRITQVSGLIKLDNLRLFDFSASPAWPTNWPSVPANYQVANTAFTVTQPNFRYPIDGTSDATSYRFNRIIEFNPLGECSRITDTLTKPPAPWIGIGLRPTRGNADITQPSGLAPSAVLIEGLTGSVKVFVP